MPPVKTCQAKGSPHSCHRRQGTPFVLCMPTYLRPELQTILCLPFNLQKGNVPKLLLIIICHIINCPMRIKMFEGRTTG